MANQMKKISATQSADGTYGVIEGTSTAKAARSRASKALSNAKQRCNNKNSPDYVNYGGAGIMVLISDLKELIAAIGLPKPGQSLDRINPNGHYQVGNIRWASAALQAANKKLSPGNAYLNVSTQVAMAKHTLALRKSRKRTAVGYVRTLRAFNEGHMPEDWAGWLYENLPVAGLIEAGFDFDTVADVMNNDPTYVHLPALSLPDARMRIRCWPAQSRQTPQHVREKGRLCGLESLPAEWNVPAGVWHRVCSLVAERGAGLILHGTPSQEDLLGGWIEGACLAMASAKALGNANAVYPLYRVSRLLINLGASHHWDNVEATVLDAPVLFIPDLCLDCGAWGEGLDINWWHVGDLLRHRYDTGLQTIVGVQNVSKLHPKVKEVVLGAYEAVQMPKTKPHPLVELAFNDVHWGVPVGSLGMRHMMSDELLSRLVSHDGCPGT